MIQTDPALGRPRRARALLLAAILLLPYAAQAEDSAVARARAFSERGRALYAAGRYADSIKEFEAGYALVPRPLFLINLGQAYRQLDQPARAREYFRRFLEVAPADDPQRADTEEIILVLDSELNRREPARPIEPPKPARPIEPPKPTRPIEPQPAIVAPVVPSPARRFVKKHWWIFPVGAVVLTGVAVGIYFGVRPGAQEIDCKKVTLGCFQ